MILYRLFYIYMISTKQRIGYKHTSTLLQNPRWKVSGKGLRFQHLLIRNFLSFHLLILSVEEGEHPKSVDASLQIRPSGLPSEFSCLALSINAASDDQSWSPSLIVWESWSLIINHNISLRHMSYRSRVVVGWIKIRLNNIATTWAWRLCHDSTTSTRSRAKDHCSIEDMGYSWWLDWYLACEFRCSLLFVVLSSLRQVTQSCVRYCPTNRLHYIFSYH